MARYWCKRCQEESNTLDPPHLCADIAKRLKRREAQKQAVLDIIRKAVYDDYADEPGFKGDEDAAEAIVKKLAQMGVTDD